MNKAEDFYKELVLRGLIDPHKMNSKKVRKVEVGVTWANDYYYDPLQREIRIDLYKLKVLDSDTLWGTLDEFNHDYIDLRNGLDKEDMWYRFEIFVFDSVESFKFIIDYTYKADVLSYIQSLEYFNLQKTVLDLIKQANASIYRSSKLVHTNLGVIDSDVNYNNRNAIFSVVLASPMG